MKKNNVVEMKGRKRHKSLDAAHERYANLTSVHLSDNQLAALRLFDPDDKDFVLKTREALYVPQGTWNSMEYRGYVKYFETYGGFKSTEVGRKHLKMMYTKDIRKEKPSSQFGIYFRELIPALSGKFKIPNTQPKHKHAGVA